MRSAAFTLAVAAVCVVAAPTASAESACEALGGTVDATVMCRIHEVGAGYERTASFPIGYPDQQAVADFLKQRGITTLPGWLDPENQLASHYKAETLPTTIYYGADGREQWRWVGGRDWGSAETAKSLGL